jgi:N-methylhydantoinase A
MRVYPDKSKEALTRLGDKLGCDATEAAAGIVRIVESNMVNNISEVSVWRGYDPRDLTLVAYGGGSGLHSVRMAAELGIKTVVSPPYPAIVSALGHIVSDVKHFFSRSYLKELSTDFRPINEFYASQQEEALRMIGSELPKGSEVHNFRGMDMRYAGQTHEIRIDIPNRDLRPADRALLARRFNSKHKELYGYSLPQYPIEIVTLLLEARGSSPSVKLRKKSFRRRSAPANDALRKRRRAYLAEKGGYSIVNCYNREKLKSGNILSGPSLVEGTESTVLIPEGWRAELDGYNNLIIRRRDN